MATVPVGIQGIVRTDTKQTDLTVAQYDGQARPGEIVVDLSTYSIYVGNLDGNLIPLIDTNLSFSNITNGTSNVSIDDPNGSVSFSVNGTPNVVVISDNEMLVSTDINPKTDAVYSLGNITNQWKELWVSGSTIYVGGVPVGTTGGNLTVNGNTVVTTTVSGTTAVNNVTASGNIAAGGNLSVAGNTSIGGNTTVGGDLYASGDMLSGGNVTGGNIISSGNVSVGGNLTTTGDISTSGNLLAGNAAISGNVTIGDVLTADNVITDTVLGRTGGITLSANGLNQSIVLQPTGTGVVDVSGATITNVLDPINAQDAATKIYVDSLAQGLLPKDPALCMAPADLSVLGGGLVTYNNGVAGVGATLTLSGPITQLDGFTLTVGDRVLIPNQINALENGVYTYTSPTVFTRALDSDNAVKLMSGSFVFVKYGTTFGSSGWTIVTEPTVVGTDPIVWAQFSGAGSYTAGTGLVLVGSQFRMATTGVTAGTYGGGANLITATINDRGQITSIANSTITTIANLTVSGTLTAANANVTSSLYTVGNITTLGTFSAANLNVSGAATITQNLTAFSNLTVSRNSNILGTLKVIDNVDVTNGNLNVNGNLNISGNLTATATNFNGNVVFYDQTNLGPVGNIRIIGGTNNQVLTTYGNGRVYWSNPNTLTSSNIIGNLSVTGSIKQTGMNLSRIGNYQPAYWVAGMNSTPPGSMRGFTIDGGLFYIPSDQLDTEYIYTRPVNSGEIGTFNNLPLLFECGVKANPTPNNGCAAFTMSIGNTNNGLFAYSPSQRNINGPGLFMTFQITADNGTNGALYLRGQTSTSLYVGSVFNNFSTVALADGLVHKYSILILRNTSTNKIEHYVFIDDNYVFSFQDTMNSANDWMTASGPAVSITGHSWQTNRPMYCNYFYFGSGQEFIYRNYSSMSMTLPS